MTIHPGLVVCLDRVEEEGENCSGGGVYMSAYETGNKSSLDPLSFDKDEV